MILDRFNELLRVDPEAVAVIDESRPWTRANLAGAVVSLQERLATQVQPGDPVVIFLSNGVEFIAAFLAIVASGGIAVPLNTHLRTEELSWYVEALGIRWVVTCGSGLRAWETLAGRFRGLQIIPGNIPSSGVAPPREIAAIDPSEPDPLVLYLSTSGSTGQPKIVPRRHSNLLLGAANVASALAIESSDRFLGVVPFHHANGFSNCMFLPLMRGAGIVTMEQFVPRRLPELVKDEEVEVLVGSPFIFRVLLEQDPGPDVFRRVRICLSSGAPMAPALVDRCREQLGISVRQLYGSTETGTIAIEPDEDGIHNVAGVPIPGVEVQILDASGVLLPECECGEIAVSSGAVMEGYLAGTGKNAPRDDGFLRTGDLGFLDEHGALHLQGRIRRGINLCGIKVDPVEIERVIGELPAVRAVRVDGSPDEHGMEMIRARIRPVPGAAVTRSDVVKQCRARLAEFKIPRVIEFVESDVEDLLGKNSV